MSHPRDPNRRPAPDHGTPGQRHERAVERRLALASRRPTTGPIHALGEEMSSKSEVFRHRVGRQKPGS